MKSLMSRQRAHMATDASTADAAAPVLLAERRGAVSLLTLNRPDRINALTPELLSALGAAIDDAVADKSVRAIVLTGAGRGFCAGADIFDFAARTDETRSIGRLLETDYEPVVHRMRDCPLPVVAAVNGVAAGAGANLALLADIVVAARSAMFVEAFGRIGLVPDVGGTWTLPRRVGAARARALCLLGDPLDAETAERWGLIWKAVDDASVLDEAIAIADRLTRQSASAIELTKTALRMSFENTFEGQIALERRLQSEAGDSADHAEGVAAFVEKRAPVWSERE